MNMYTSSLPLLVSHAWLPFIYFTVTILCFLPSRHFTVTLEWALSLISPKHTSIFRLFTVFPIYYIFLSIGKPSVCLHSAQTGVPCTGKKPFFFLSVMTLNREVTLTEVVMVLKTFNLKFLNWGGGKECSIDICSS